MPDKVSRHIKHTRTSPVKKLVFKRRERVLTPTKVEAEPAERARPEGVPVKLAGDEPVEDEKEDEE